MAFRQSDGSRIWARDNPENSYSSPILFPAGGRDQVGSFMAKEVMGAAGTESSRDVTAAFVAKAICLGRE